MKDSSAQTSGLDHLGQKAAAIMNDTVENRIEYIRSPRWIGYTQAKTIIARLEDLMEYPKRDRMPNILIVGHTNNGKTSILERFKSLHPAYDHIEGEAAQVPVLVVESPPVPDELRFYNEILNQLFVSYKIKEDKKVKSIQVLSLLKNVGTKLLVIDEIHNLLSGTASKQREFLNVIKSLGNQLKIPIVGAGTKEALRAVNSNPQLANRFEPIPLPRWNVDSEFRRLLLSFERMIPLRNPSNLGSKTIASKLYSMSEGYIGELALILERAAVLSIKKGTEKIDDKILKSINWTVPSNRRKMAESII